MLMFCCWLPGTPAKPSIRSSYQMDCPQCHNNETNSSGICLVCGYHTEEPPKKIEEAKHESPSPKSDLPQWRQELSERLQSIKQKNESNVKAVAPVVAPAPAIDKPRHQPNPVPKSRRQAAASPAPCPPAPQQKILAPLDKADPKEIEKLIDKAVSRQSVPSPEKQHSLSSTSVPIKEQTDFYEEKLILLSRTLAGLVDLMIVALCTGIIIIASDYFSGIIALDFISFAVYSVLFLMIQLVYSIFFLAASTQTIGMMITDLRIVGRDGRRPLLRQIFSRCFSYLLSLFVLGIGLAWSLFDAENRCFHDRLSGTQVVRI
jgi:uncharacterized RDD family membrane protein YckC